MFSKLETDYLDVSSVRFSEDNKTAFVHSKKLHDRLVLLGFTTGNNHVAIDADFCGFVNTLRENETISSEISGMGNKIRINVHGLDKSFLKFAKKQKIKIVEISNTCKSFKLLVKVAIFDY